MSADRLALRQAVDEVDEVDRIRDAFNIVAGGDDFGLGTQLCEHVFLHVSASFLRADNVAL